MQDVLASISAKVSEINDPNTSALETIYSLNLECDRLRADLAMETNVSLCFVQEASDLHDERDKLKQQVDSLITLQADIVE